MQRHTPANNRVDWSRPAPSYDGPPAPRPVFDAALVSRRNPSGSARVAALIAEVDRRERDERADRLDRLRALYLESGLSLHKIGMAMGMKASSVAAQAARYGWVRLGGVGA